MAYVKGPTTSIESSASLLPCNLSVLLEDGKDPQGEPWFSVIHKHVAVLGKLGSTSDQHRVACYGKVEDKSLLHLTHTRWCKLENDLVVLVLASYKGFQIMDRNGSKELYSNKFETPPGSASNRFAKGIASLQNYVCIGTAEGAILMYNVNESATQIELTKQLEGHTAPISDLIADGKGRRLISADEQGTINLWQDIGTATEPTIAINDSSGVPCLCLAFQQPYIVGGFANGQLRLYDCETGLKVMDVSAHARPVMALDAAPATGLLLSASEDCTVCVWAVGSSGTPKMSLTHVEAVENAVIAGARFTNSKGTGFAVSAYDSHEILTFTTTPA